ncbi:MAG TPA: MerR family transcriptional regulator [Ornithinicoccus sp.]|nr:MerR family transcriptional regulator [Ornithinicoccus sp.]
MTLLTIGAVLRELQQEFPELTVSKIRFLESEGLVLPQRRESGQRAFSVDDVNRIRFVLRAQRDRFWPLKVIKGALDRMDLGDEAEASAPGRLRLADAAPADGGAASEPTASATEQKARGGEPDRQGADEARPAPRLPTATQLRRRRAVRLSPAELRQHTGLDVAAYTQLKAFGLIRLDSSGRHSADDLDVARECTILAAYGLEPRHLRLFRVAADREVGLAQQILEPVRRRRARGAADADPEELETEIIAHTLALHVALVRAGLGQTQ